MDGTTDPTMRAAAPLCLLAADVLREASRELRYLRLVRGASRRTGRQIARATAVLLAAAALLGAGPLARPARASDPHFLSPYPRGLYAVGSYSKPAFTDIDGDGDLDAFIGVLSGHTLFFRNTGTPQVPAFAAPLTDPFGLADAGAEIRPAFADIDGDRDFDAFIGNRDGEVLFFRNTGSVQAPAFASRIVLTDVGNFSRPTLADIDGDGDFDAFVGELGGDIIFFLNTGSTQVPTFAAPVTNPFGLADVGKDVSPTFADIDGDGDLDAFLAHYEGNIFFFRNTGSAQAPAFAPPVDTPFGLSSLYLGAGPALVDIDGDGDLDAFIGVADGSTLFFRNTGNARSPAFAVPPPGLPAQYRLAAPALADIDGDGDLDAFVGNQSGRTVFFRNTGSAQAPAFATPVDNPFSLTGVGYRSSPAFADIDGDGDLDAFVGTREDNTIFFRNTGNARVPAFATPVENPFGLVGVEFSSVAPAFADLDADGDLDLFLANIFLGDAHPRNIRFFQNTGNAVAPAFGPPLELEDTPYWHPAFADIDGDGDLDALAGDDYGSAILFRNTGTARVAAFAAPVTNPFGLVRVGFRCAPALADIDGDGDLDAFIGTENGRTLFFENRVCPGDCDTSGQVSIDELIRGVNIALDNLDLSACGAMDGNGDGAVTIGELIAAVNAALSGCPP
jgi:hypothetical protein